MVGGLSPQDARGPVIGCTGALSDFHMMPEHRPMLTFTVRRRSPTLLWLLAPCVETAGDRKHFSIRRRSEQSLARSFISGHMTTLEHPRWPLRVESDKAAALSLERQGWPHPGSGSLEGLGVRGADSRGIFHHASGVLSPLAAAIGACGAWVFRLKVLHERSSAHGHCSKK